MISMALNVLRILPSCKEWLSSVFEWLHWRMGIFGRFAGKISGSMFCRFGVEWPGFKIQVAKGLN